MDTSILKHPKLLHVRNGRSDLVRGFTVIAEMRVIAHHQITLLYIVIALSNLIVMPNGIQCITRAGLFMCSGCTQTSSVSDFQRPATEIVSSSRPSSSTLPTINTSGKSGRDRSGLHWSHPMMTRCQTLTQLGVSCRNLARGNQKN